MSVSGLRPRAARGRASVPARTPGMPTGYLIALLGVSVAGGLAAIPWNWLVSAAAYVVVLVAGSILLVRQRMVVANITRRRDRIVVGVSGLEKLAILAMVVACLINAAVIALMLGRLT